MGFALNCMPLNIKGIKHQNNVYEDINNFKTTLHNNGNIFVREVKGRRTKESDWRSTRVLGTHIANVPWASIATHYTGSTYCYNLKGRNCMKVLTHPTLPHPTFTRAGENDACFEARNTNTDITGMIHDLKKLM
jgi:hypothetical protein